MADPAFEEALRRVEVLKNAIRDRDAARAEVAELRRALAEEKQVSVVANAKVAKLSVAIEEMFDAVPLPVADVITNFSDEEATAAYGDVVEEERAFACGECQNVFDTVQQLRSHAWVHKARQFACPSCSYAGMSPNYLRRHVETKHKKIA